ncbi:MAG: DNA repair exonuclease [Proteobacteria bacterium]|nr:DNA repair exonuclease [Pseudomonadota bacterium]
MQSFTFVHAADLHLDSPFSGLTARAPLMAQVMRDATFKAFSSVVDLCLEENAAFLLLSGDLFEWEEKSLRAASAFYDGVRRLGEKGIPVFAVHGNHDPAASRPLPLKAPENLYVFGHEEVETREVIRDGEVIARVSGISYAAREEKRNLATLFPKGKPGGPFHAGVLHANVGGNTGHADYAPCSLADLTAAGVDYWALGHVHEHRVVSESPMAVYPGNTQGRSFRETGQRGCCLVKVQGRRSRVRFVATDSFRFLARDLSIEPFDDLADLEDALCEAVGDLASQTGGRPLVARVALTGRSPLYEELSRTGVLPDLVERGRVRFFDGAEGVFLEDLDARFKPGLDLPQRMRAGDLVGQVLSLAAEAAASPEALELIRDRALGELFGNRDLTLVAGQPDDEELAQLLEEAGLLCMDLLEGGA